MAARPEEVPAADATAPGYMLFDTAFGVCGLAWSAAGLTRLQLPEQDAAETTERLSRGGLQPAPPPEFAARARDALVAYFAGTGAGAGADFSTLPLDLADTPPFHRRIYEILRSVEPGRTATYGALATAAGSPGSARAVGQAMAKNPLPVIIPCHRVLAAGGKAGGFSAPGGLLTKERLLALEGVAMAPALPLFDGLSSSGDSRS